MSCEEHKGTIWAWQEMMRLGAEAIATGELKPARVVAKRADPRKISIGYFAAKILRMRKKAS